MNEIPYHNSTNAPVHIGSLTVMPGDTRMVDPIYLRVKKQQEAKSQNPATGFESLSGDQLLKKLELLSDEEFTSLDHTLNGTPDTPKDLVKAIVNERNNREAIAKIEADRKAYSTSLSKMKPKELQGELLAVAEDAEKLAMVQAELSTRGNKNGAKK